MGLPGVQQDKTRQGLTMKHVTSIPRRFDRRLLSSAIATCLLAAAPNALSQSASATLRGQVSAGEQPVAAASVSATNTETGLTRRVQTEASGAYNLAGLPPGTYKVEASGPTGATARLVTLQVGQTWTWGWPRPQRTSSL
jgi:hypothetical protein